MNKQFLLAQKVHDVISDKIINIEIMSHKLYYGETKIKETIVDVNSYLNYLTIEEIYSRILGEDFETCSDIINHLVADFNTSFLQVRCQVPKKYNFNVNDIKEVDYKNDSPGIFFEIIVILSIIITLIATYFSR